GSLPPVAERPTGQPRLLARTRVRRSLCQARRLGPRNARPVFSWRVELAAETPPRQRHVQSRGCAASRLHPEAGPQLSRRRRPCAEGRRRRDRGPVKLEHAREQGEAMETRYPGGGAPLHSWLAEAYLLAGRVDEATRLAGQALELYREHQERGNEAWATRLLGEITSHAERLVIEDAERHYREAMSLAAQLGMRPLVAHCHLGLGALYGRAGQRERGREHLTTASTMYRDMDMRFWLRRAEAQM